MNSIEQILRMLIQQNIKNSIGIIRFDFAGLSFPVTSKDIVGSVLQEWFEHWLKHNQLVFSKPFNTQEPPDFFLADGSHLEVKAFNYAAKPGFDLANFDAYTRSLLIHPERLDANHLIFGYRLVNQSITIVDIWVKKIWELAGTSHSHPLSLQVKQGVPVNIRPKDWRRTDGSFGNRLLFVEALNAALVKFYPQRYPNNVWLDQIKQTYLQQTGQNL